MNQLERRDRYFSMRISFEELDYKTHAYSECKLVDKDCDECERYYWEFVHKDFCDETCPQRYEDIEGGSASIRLDLGRCRGCICDHCWSETNTYEEEE